MGKQEQSAKERQRIGKLERAILTATYAAGVLSVAVVAPKALSLLPKIPVSNANYKYRTRSTITRLVQKGLITITSNNGLKSIELTSKGTRFIDKETSFASVAPKHPKRWDRQWRIVIFDIPDTKKRARTHLRRTMASAGFVKLQNSVWVFPYDCEDLVDLLKIDLKIGREVLYIIAAHIENDTELRKHFNLPD